LLTLIINTTYGYAHFHYSVTKFQGYHDVSWTVYDSKPKEKNITMRT